MRRLLRFEVGRAQGAGRLLDFSHKVLHPSLFLFICEALTQDVVSEMLFWCLERVGGGNWVVGLVWSYCCSIARFESKPGMEGQGTLGWDVGFYATAY